MLIRRGICEYSFLSSGKMKVVTAFAILFRITLFFSFSFFYVTIPCDTQTPKGNRSKQTTRSRMAGMGSPRNTLQHSQTRTRRIPTGYMGMRSARRRTEWRASMR